MYQPAMLASDLAMVQRKARQVKAKRALRRYFQLHPEAWLQQVLGLPEHAIRWSAFDGYGKHEWDGTPDPFLHLCRSLAEHKNVGIEAGTGTGKTWFISRLAYWFLDVFENSLVITTAPKQQQLKAVMWSEINAAFPAFRLIRPQAERYSLRVLPLGSNVANMNTTGEEGNDDWQMIGVVSGVGADEASATKMQGYHRQNMLIIVDEAAGVSPAVFTAIKNTCTDSNNLIVATGNPDAVTDALHQFCELPHVEHIRISSYDHPNVVTKKTVFPGAVTIRSIDQRRDEYGEKDRFFQSRIRGIAPAQASDALILHEWVARACRYRPEYDHNIIDQNEKSTPEKPIYVDCENALGMDVANSQNGDKACLVWGRRNVVKAIEEFQCPNANALADNVVFADDILEKKNLPVYGTSKLTDYSVDPWRVAVDAVGVGVGTINQFKALNYLVYGVQGGVVEEAIPVDDDDNPLYTFTNARAQMFFQLRLDLMREEIIFDIPDEQLRTQMIKELTNVKYKVSDRSILIEGKEQIKARLGGKSPNILDAIVYWNWIRKSRGHVGDAMPFGMR